MMDTPGVTCVGASPARIDREAGESRIARSGDRESDVHSICRLRCAPSKADQARASHLGSYRRRAAARALHAQRRGHARPPDPLETLRRRGPTTSRHPAADRAAEAEASSSSATDLLESEINRFVVLEHDRVSSAAPRSTRSPTSGRGGAGLAVRPISATRGAGERLLKAIETRAKG